MIFSTLSACGSQEAISKSPDLESTVEPSAEPTTGPHVHSYSETVVKQATCTEAGTKKYTCDCGDTYTENIDKTDHSYTSAVTKPADCTAEGVKTYSCSVCNHTYTESISKANHKYNSKVTKKPTCTDTGIKTFTCSVCGDSYTETLTALEHDYVDGVCSVCGDDINKFTLLSGDSLPKTISGGKMTVSITGFRYDIFENGRLMLFYDYEVLEGKGSYNGIGLIRIFNKNDVCVAVGTIIGADSAGAVRRGNSATIYKGNKLSANEGYFFPDQETYYVRFYGND